MIVELMTHAIVIDIFLYAAEEDARAEAELVLWASSLRHRTFLLKNFEWYPNNLGFKLTAWKSLRNKSELIKYLNQGRFLFEHIRIEGKREVQKVTRLYTASKDGWTSEDFHRHCDSRGPTVCIFRISNNQLAAGFTSCDWTSPTFSKDVFDPSAMVFRLSPPFEVY